MYEQTSKLIENGKMKTTYLQHTYYAWGIVKPEGLYVKFVFRWHLHITKIHKNKINFLQFQLGHNYPKYK